MATHGNIELFWNGKDVKIKMDASKIKSVLHGALAMQAQATMLAPVKSGQLRGSITIRFKDRDIKSGYYKADKSGTQIDKPNDDDTAYVGTAVNYAPYLEYGTARSVAQPFMRPALDLVQGKILNIFEKNGKIELQQYFSEKGTSFKVNAAGTEFTEGIKF